MVHGFTLIELMITVAIIAVLAAVALPAYQKYVRKAVYSEFVTQMGQVQRAITECMTISRNLEECNTLAQLHIDLPAVASGRATLEIDPASLAIRLEPNYRGLSASDYCVLRPRSVVLFNLLQDWFYLPSAPCVTQGFVRS